MLFLSAVVEHYIQLHVHVGISRMIIHAVQAHVRSVVPRGEFLFDAHHNNVPAMPPLSAYLCVLLTPDVVAQLKQHGIRTGEYFSHAVPMQTIS